MRGVIEILRDDLAANNELRTGCSGLIRAWFFDPGFRCVSLVRLSIWLRTTGGVGRLLSRLVVNKLIGDFGVYFSTDCIIGKRLRLPHPVGIVVGKGVKIGDDVTIYQNVTLGRSSADVESYPSIGSGVVVYAGAVIVGGIDLGGAACVGANSVVISDVPAGCVVAGVPARVLIDKNSQALKF